MAVTIYQTHEKANQLAAISNPKSGFMKYLYGDEWTLDEWNKIIEFYKNHETFRIDVE